MLLQQHQALFTDYTKAKLKLWFDEIREIFKKTAVPLVLHGGSDILLHQAIELDPAKVNVNTENIQAWTSSA